MLGILDVVLGRGVFASNGWNGTTHSGRWECESKKNGEKFGIEIGLGPNEGMASFHGDYKGAVRLN